MGEAAETVLKAFDQMEFLRGMGLVPEMAEAGS
jgi:hypothetical protein